MNLRLACFVTPHGYGHAARTAAVLSAIRQFEPSVEFHIFTSVPDWFFRDSIGDDFIYHPLVSDVGLIQKDPFIEDLDATLKLLDQFYPPNSSLVNGLARQLRQSEVGLVLCDIAPIGILAAKQAGIPSILLENFTWDWIYSAYVSENPLLQRHIQYLSRLFQSADHHFQTKPFCAPSPKVEMIFPPASRSPHHSPQEIRERLHIPPEAKVILMTLGGILADPDFWTNLPDDPHYYFIIPTDVPNIETRGNSIFLPHHSSYYHPDLVNASDAVIGKTGYSTLAEVYYAGIPFGYIPRPAFPESDILGTFIECEMHGMEISLASLGKGTWGEYIPELLALPKIHREGQNGSTLIGNTILNLFHKRFKGY